MNLRLPGMGEGSDKPAVLGDGNGGGSGAAPERTMGGMPAGAGGSSPSMDYSAQSIDAGGGAMAPSAAAPLIRGLVVLGVLVAVAGGGLFVMRSMGKRGLVEDPNVKIDMDGITAVSEEVTGDDHSALLEDLRGAGEFAQVPLDNVQMNPFTLRVPTEQKAVVAREAPGESPEQRAERERAERIAALQRDVERLRLNSVMAGSVPIAQISGTLVRVGDLINERFRVSKIEGRSVELTAEGQVFVLVIGE
ncbi:MAG: hypothetical protein ACTS3F_11635 [Phycisphaerales bacterium]